MQRNRNYSLPRVTCPDCGEDVIPEWDDYSGDYRCPNDYEPLVNDDGSTLDFGED